jgi:hypothetical protein
MAEMAGIITDITVGITTPWILKWASPLKSESLHFLSPFSIHFFNGSIHLFIISIDNYNRSFLEFEYWSIIADVTSHVFLKVLWRCNVSSVSYDQGTTFTICSRSLFMQYLYKNTSSINIFNSFILSETVWA